MYPKGFGLNISINAPVMSSDKTVAISKKIGHRRSKDGVAS